MTNVDQREAWNGASGEEWVRTEEQHDSQLVPWAELLAATADVQPGERVLDVGCGTGATTLAAARAAGAEGGVVGVDLSAPMTARARERATEQGLTNVRFEVGDAQTDDLTLGGEPYDVVISRFGVMFFDDPRAAFANMHRAMRPGGRLAMVVWAPLELQDWLRVPMLAAIAHVPAPENFGGAAGGPGMFALADVDGATDILGGAGWKDIALEPHERTMLLGGPGTLDETVQFVLGSNAGRTVFNPDNAPPDAIERGIAAMRAALAKHQTPQGVELKGTGMLITARS